MPEILLHYIWQQRLWADMPQATTDNQPVEILSVGQHNRDAGPDFSHARVRIGTHEWVGNVEMHVRASDWRRHRHHTNPAYDNVVLHVVCEADEPTYNTRGECIPQCVLRYPHNQDYLTQLFAHAQQMDSVWANVPCHSSLLLQPSLLTQGWRDTLLQQRLQCRQEAIMQLLQITHHNWAEAFYITLAHNFGFHTNSLPFETLALCTPLAYLLKHRNSLFQVTAILLGQSGLLNEQTIKNEEEAALLREYQFLKQKFSLQSMAASLWKRARLRPQNAPQIRIRQFAQLICQSEWLFSQMLVQPTVNDLRQLLCLQSPTTSAEYTQSIISAPPAIGKKSIDILLINTLLPYRYAYALAHSDTTAAQMALTLMHQIPAEDNTIIRQWRLLGQQVTSAADTQALIHLYQHYCQNERCIHCEVGQQVFLLNHIS